MKTRYRTVSNGYWDYLEYEVETKGFFGTKHSWQKVPQPFYDEYEGRANVFGLDSDSMYVNSLRTDLVAFVAKYPDIAEYFPVYLVAQAKIKEQAQVKNSERAKRKGIIKYLS